MILMLRILKMIVWCSLEFGSVQWVIVKNQETERARQVVDGTRIKITADGRRLLGCVIGKHENKNQYQKRKDGTMV